MLPVPSNLPRSTCREGYRRNRGPFISRIINCARGAIPQTRLLASGSRLTYREGNGVTTGIARAALPPVPLRFRAGSTTSQRAVLPWSRFNRGVGHPPIDSRRSRGRSRRSRRLVLVNCDLFIPTCPAARLRRSSDTLRHVRSSTSSLLLCLAHGFCSPPRRTRTRHSEERRRRLSAASGM